MSFPPINPLHKNQGGLCHLPEGKKYYAYLIKSSTGDYRSVREIQKHLYQQLFLDFEEIQNLVQKDPDIFTKAAQLPQTASSSPEQMLDYLSRVMTDDFPKLTVKDYEVKYVPDSMEEFSSPAFYLTPPVDTLTPNTIYINQSTTVSDVQRFTTLAHEGFPGHLYQTVYFGKQDCPPIRHLLGCSGYVEGWATYVENMAYEYSCCFLQTDPEVMEFLRLNRSVTLCLYSILDIGIHDTGWNLQTVQELLKSAGLYGRDIVTGEEGFNLAAIMLLGKDDVILNVAPTYVTDALVRKVNVDRYDDREIIKTNLIESYSQLLDFGRKNLPDKFFLEDTVNKSLRNTIVREMISNTLMHREFTSSYTAKFVIEKDRMYVENANRATKEGFITVDNLEPNPKNPLIASFFRNIGYADQLGSGVRKLFKYSKYYSGKDPLFVEDDVFRIIVPLDDAYSFDYGIEAGSSKVIESNNADKMPINADKMPINAGKTLVNSLSAQQNSIIQFAKETGSIKSRQVEELLGVKQRRARRILGELVNMGILERQGAYKSTVYVLKN